MKKKTIAILLVLVIGMVGVFAANTPASSDVKITTAITPKSLIRITSVAYDAGASGAPTTYDTFDTWAKAIGVDDATAINVASTDSSSPTEIGNLTYYTNKPTGLSVTFAATPLADNAELKPVTTVIKYTVKVGDQTAIAGATKGTLGTASGSVTLVSSGVTGVSMGSKPISVYLDSSDYALAAVAASKYIGTITFSYISD